MLGSLIDPGFTSRVAETTRDKRQRTDRGEEFRTIASARPRAARRESVGARDVVVSGRGRAPVARNKGSTSRLRGKFSSLQILENSQNAERTSILRETVPNAQGTRCTYGGGAARVGHAHDPSVLADGKTESPGNGAATA
jgi:hypothetical protein